MMLKIKIPDLPPEGQVVPLEIPAKAAQSGLAYLEGDAPILSGPIQGELTVEPAGGRVVVRGRFTAQVRGVCARCLEELDRPVGEEVMVVFTPAPPGMQTDLAEPEEDGQEFLVGEEIDLWPVVVEHLLLSLPLRFLCQDDCRGLCPVCGQNLNQGRCGCPPPSAHPGLAGLKDFKFPTSR